jgi:hypothetical protein
MEEEGSESPLAGEDIYHSALYSSPFDDCGAWEQACVGREAFVRAGDARPAVGPGVGLAVGLDGPRVLAEAMWQWESYSCMFQAELCDFGTLYRSGMALGDWAQASVRSAMQQYVALGMWARPAEPSWYVYRSPEDFTAWDQLEDEPAGDLPTLAVAASDAAASDAAASDAAVLAEQSGEAARMESLVEGGLALELDLDRMGRRTLARAAGVLEAFGGQLQQAAGRLARWADPQIASRDESSIR